MQVNSLGLTESQPENNVYRILIQMLPVVIARNSRARAVQLPAWNEALGLPRPWDQQWSLRLQQIMAYETDLLEFNDIFAGSDVLRNKVNDLKDSAYKELKSVDKFMTRGTFHDIYRLLASIRAGAFIWRILAISWQILPAFQKFE